MAETYSGVKHSWLFGFVAGISIGDKAFHAKKDQFPDEGGIFELNEIG